jgi:hypothetical protein
MWESGKSSIDDKLSFPRVESLRNLTSRRSLITTMLHQNGRAAALQNAASKSGITTLTHLLATRTIQCAIS